MRGTAGRMLGGGALVLGVAGTSLAGVAAGRAAAGVIPAIHVDRRCYVDAGNRATIHVTGSGWTPGDGVTVTGGAATVSATVGAAGAFQVADTVPRGDFALRAQGERLSATETDATTHQPVPGISAGAPYLVTGLAYSVSPQDASFTRKVTFRFSGFTAGREIFAHYLRRGSVVARQRFGRTTGPCGLLSTRALQYPGGHPGSQSYRVQFDDARAYARRSTPRIVTQLSVFRF